jgi:HAMP domain-containing protein
VPGASVRTRLFRKYVALFVTIVCAALLANGLLDIWFSYQDHKDSLIRIQQEQAEAAAGKISQFVKEVEAQLGWTVQLPWSASTIDQRRVDAVRLLRLVPAVTEFSQLDPGRGATGVCSSPSRAGTGGFLQERQVRQRHGEPGLLRASLFSPRIRAVHDPRYCRNQAGRRHKRRRGQSQADLGCGLADQGRRARPCLCRGFAGTLDRAPGHQSGAAQHRYVEVGTGAGRIGGAGCRMSPEPLQVAKDVEGRQVLTTYAAIAPLGWLVFVELPRDEAYQPLYLTIQRTGVVLLAALGLAVLAGMFLARKMVVPIQALQAGAARIGSGDLSQRISIKTGDELEALADQFNDMAVKLQDSYTNLERKVEARTREP